MSVLEKPWDMFRSFVNIVCTIFCVVVIAALDIQIFCRFFLGFSTTWSEELAEVCFTGLIFCYLAQAEKEGAHLQLEIIYQIWPKTKFYLMVVGKAICCVYCAFVVYSEVLLLPTIGKLTTPACHIPVPWVHILIALGSVMWIIQNLISIVDLFHERRAAQA